MYFEQPSTRTRLAFHGALHADGGYAISCNKSDLHLDTKETLHDTALAISNLVSALVYRGVDHAQLENLSAASTIPVINALTARYHPTQALADMLTISEHFKKIEGIKIAYFGDSNNNVARSLAIASCRCDNELYCASPQQFALDQQTLELCEAISMHHKRLPKITDDPYEAARQADVIYTDVWSSMGSASLSTSQRDMLQPYRVTSRIVAAAAEHAIFLHCLPAVRGEEVDAEVIDGPKSMVWTQAANRHYSIRALMRAILSR